MDKKILSDYTDACELIEETEKDIKRLKEKKSTIVQTVVTGSNPEYPYQPRHFGVAGTAYTYRDDAQLRLEEKLLDERKANAEKLKLQVEAYLNTIPMRMQRIIRYRFFEGLSWEQVADRIGKKATGDSVRKELERFLAEK